MAKYSYNQGDRETIKVPTLEKPVDFTDESPICQYFKDEERQKTLIDYVIENGEAAVRARGDYERRIRGYQERWQGVTYPKTIPHENASNTRSMKTYTAVDIISNRLSAPFVESEPPASFIAERPEGQDQARLIEEYFQHVLENKINFKSKIIHTIRNCVRDGDAFVKTKWNYASRLIKEEVEVPIIMEIPDPETGDLVQVDTGQTEPKTVTRQEIYANYPDFEIVQNFDLIFPATARSTQLEKCDFIIHRVTITEDELKRRGASGFYENVDKVNKPMPEDDRYEEGTGNRSSTIDTLGVLEGVQKRNDDAPSDMKEIEIWEFWGRYDINGDGYEEEAVCTIAPKQKLLLRVAPNPYKHGQRPFVQFPYILRDNGIQSIGLAALIGPTEDLIDSFRNIRIDLLMLAACPVFVATPEMRLQITNGTIRPGMILEADNPSEALLAIKFPTAEPGLIMEENILDHTVEQVSGVTPGLHGEEQVNRPTARGTIALLAEAQGRFKQFLFRITESMERLMFQLFGNIQQYQEGDEVFAMTGKEGLEFKTLSREQIQNNYLVKISPTAINRQLARENEMLYFNTVLQMANIPFQQQTAQTGINLREMLRMIGKNLNIRNLDQIILPQAEVDRLVEQQIQLKEMELKLAMAQMQMQQQVAGQQAELANVPVNRNAIPAATQQGDNFRQLMGNV